MEDRYLSLTEARDALGISERTAYRWIKAGKLRAYKPGRDYRIPESAIEEAIQAGGEVHPKVESPSSLEPTFNDVLEDERREDVYDMVLAAARRQAEQDRQATNRALESERPQRHFADHENEVVVRLLEECAPDEVAGTLVEMARGYVQLESQLKQSKEATSAEAARSAAT
jgi:excisionase family DNA binding protein